MEEIFKINITKIQVLYKQKKTGATMNIYDKDENLIDTFYLSFAEIIEDNEETKNHVIAELRKKFPVAKDCITRIEQ